MRLCSISSGSDGNCAYVGTDTTHILVDAGASGKKIFAALEELSISPDRLSGILVSHEHMDHISGLGVLGRRLGLPIFATAATLDRIWQAQALGKMDKSWFHAIEADRPFALGDLAIEPFSVSHDAADPVGFSLAQGEKRMAICTDLGEFDEYVEAKLAGVHALLLEANHDVHMVEAGPYPYALKQRILGKKGHLSNELAGRLLSKLLHPGLHTVLLGHLSGENNLPQLAAMAVRMELGDYSGVMENLDLRVAHRGRPSPVVFV